MIKLMIFVIGCYVAAGLVVHLYYLARAKRSSEEKHYVLIAGQESMNMEWYFRSMVRFSTCMGVDVNMTIVDQDAPWELKKMIYTWQREGHGITLATHLPIELNTAVVVDLNESVNLYKLPF